MNPYQSPQAATDAEPARPPWERLFRIAKLQRELGVLVLLQFVIYVAAGILRSLWGSVGGSPSSPASAHLAVAYLVLAIVTGLAFIVVGIISIITTVQIAYTMHGTAVAIMCSILLFVPCVGFITQLGLHASATTPLRGAGFRVGLLGADIDAIARDIRAQQQSHGAPPRDKLGPKVSGVLSVALLLSGLAAGCVFAYNFHLHSIEQQVVYNYGGVVGEESVNQMNIFGPFAAVLLLLGLGILLLGRRKKQEETT